jgi:hypothetical protein
VAFDDFNRVAAHGTYPDADRAALLGALETLRVLERVDGVLRRNPNPFEDAWALLRENCGDFLVAPDDAEPRIVATGRPDWLGWVELTTRRSRRRGTRRRTTPRCGSTSTSSAKAV